MQGALGVGSAALSAYALSKAIPSNISSLISAVSGAPGQNQTSLPKQETKLQTNNKIPLEPSQEPSQPPLDLGNANIQQPTYIHQPKQNSNIIDKLYTSFEKGRDKGFDFDSDAFLKVAKRMKSTGEINSKQDFERFFNLFDAKKNEGKDLPTALKEASIEYDGQKLSLTEQLTQNENQKSLNEPIKIEKNSVVSSPNGVGELKELRNGYGLVDVDGKLHKVKEEDLES